MKELEEATITDFHGTGTAIYCPCCSATNLTKEILENNSIFVCCMCNSEVYFSKASNGLLHFLFVFC